MLQPTNKEIISKLNKVLSGKLTREEVVEWAMKFIEYDELEVFDFISWEFLKIVGGIDMIESPNIYLYSFDDIKAWIKEYSENI